tara:strand:+ start:7139 stop:8209 length:1071 start_codon:yes stop_codon:yes gene_type:complete
MDHVMLYHWWGSGGKVAHNMKIPIILSIATVRAHNKDISIVVMDLSEGEQDWEDYPKKLNFKLERINHYLPIDIKRYGFKKTPWHGIGETESKPVDLHMMSRPFDFLKCAERQPENKIIGCDSDIFWLRDPLPLILEEEHWDHNGFIPNFVVDGNLGLFYYDKRSEQAQMVGKMWMAFCLQALYDATFRKEIIKITPHYPIIIDELIMNWAIAKGVANPTPTPKWENFHISGFRSYAPIEDIQSKVKNCHCLLSITGPERGRFCQVVKEFYDPISTVLSPKDLDDIFGYNHERRKWSIINFHKTLDKKGVVTNDMWKFLGQGDDYMTQLDHDFKATRRLLQTANQDRNKLTRRTLI